jgi:signal transduction histidine kinase
VNLIVKLNRLQRKVLLVILAIVVVPMLAAAILASEWVASGFEERLGRWIQDASHSSQVWLQAYQNDAVMLGGILADDPEFAARLDEGVADPIRQPVARISQELGITFIQIYTPQQQLVYSSVPVRMGILWERGQTEAVLKVGYKGTNQLAAVGITRVPRSGAPRYYLVMGSLLNQDFIDELSNLTGMKNRLYYREGANFIDVFSRPGKSVHLSNLPAGVLRMLQKDKKPYYSVDAEQGKFRGQYTPVVDTEGRVEAIIFTGLERRGFEEVVTNRVVLFLAISVVGLVIGGLMGLILSRLVLRPVEDLRNAVMQLAAQNFSATVPVASDDELGDLAQAFNAMAVSLREARDEQQQAFQRDKLAALGELSAALAHEIRNPIGVINTASALLEKAGQTPEKKTELIRMLREESQRVGNLVQDFLQLSRHRQPNFVSIDPASPMERALATALAGRDNIRIRRHIEHNDTRIMADAGLLQQAWGNILTNAIQAMGEQGGDLYVSTSSVNGHVLLSIEDSGPGIAAEVMPRLFEPFFTTKEQGTGLGLSLANTLVEANGGKLEVLPPEHGGARFAMRFALYPRSET